jgi:hypothetical protein
MRTTHIGVPHNGHGGRSLGVGESKWGVPGIATKLPQDGLGHHRTGGRVAGTCGSWVGILQERNTILPQFVTGPFKERHIPLTALERVASAQQVSEASLVATRGQADKILKADWNPVLDDARVQDFARPSHHARDGPRKSLV